MSAPKITQPNPGSSIAASIAIIAEAVAAPKLLVPPCGDPAVDAANEAVRAMPPLKLPFKSDDPHADAVFALHRKKGGAS